MLQELNPEQSAVQHGDGPLLIVAGAGTGKTATLVHRVAHLIERAVPTRDASCCSRSRGAPPPRCCGASSPCLQPAPRSGWPRAPAA